MAADDLAPGTSIDRPLRFERHFLKKVWGGRALEQAPGIELTEEGPIGETWELVDRDDHNSVVADGAFAGLELRGLMLSCPKSLLGDARPTAQGAFPLLIKYLDARKPLSVQVHPDHATAKRMGVEGGKEECWYILSAEPRALIYLGLKPDVDASQFAEKAAGADVIDLLMPWEVKAGQFVHVPPGTVHAIGGGITLAEVQENCDVTFRLYDWGRMDLNGRQREAHVEQALLAMQYEQALEGPVTPQLTSLDELNRHAKLLDAPAFSVELLDLGGHLELETGGRPDVYVVVGGRGLLFCDDKDGERCGEPRTIRAGDVLLVPASVGRHALELDGEELRVLRVRAGS
jgi:mannose-6-phosphate isomerase